MKSAIILAAIASVSSFAQADSITEQMRSEDVRLQLRVSLNAPRMYVGELLRELSRQSKVELQADEGDGAADQIVAAYLRAVPLEDALDGLWSLLSHRGASYHWQRDRMESGFAYRLRRPFMAQQFAAKTRDQVQTAFEEEAATLIAALSLSPQELDRLAKADSRVEGMLNHPTQWHGLSLFAESVPPDARVAVLRGGSPYRVPTSRLSSASKSFVHKARKDFSGSRILPDGTKVPYPEPTWIQFYVSPGPASVPSLFAAIEGIGGYSYLGGPSLQKKLLAQLGSMWKLPGDSANSRHDDKKLVLLPGSRTEEMETVLTRRVRELSEVASISILARLPLTSGYETDPGPPANVTLSEYISRLTAPLPPHLLHKWRRGTLLITHAAWYKGPDPAPWKLVKRIKDTEGGRRGWLPLKELITISGQLSRQELLTLSAEFKVLKAASEWRELFAMLASEPKVLNEIGSMSGVPLARVEHILGTMRPLSPLLRRSDLAGATVRLFESDDFGGSVQLKVYKDGKEIGGAGFINRRPSQKSKD